MEPPGERAGIVGIALFIEGRDEAMTGIDVERAITRDV